MSDFKEVKIGNGSVFAEIIYDKGGMSYFTSRQVERGYYIIVQNSRNTMAVFSGLDKPDGAAKMLIEPTGRLSRKRLAELEKDIEFHTEELLKMSAQAGKLPLVFQDYEKVAI